MLSKPRRLTERKDFSKLAIKGRAIFGPYATLRVIVRSGPTRIAFITSTKVFKLAVDRNRAKRRMREVVRLFLPQIPEGYALLFILKPESKTAAFSELQTEVRRMIERIPEALTKPPKPSTRGKKILDRRARRRPSSHQHA